MFEVPWISSEQFGKQNNSAYVQRTWFRRLRRPRAWCAWFDRCAWCAWRSWCADVIEVFGWFGVLGVLGAHGALGLIGAQDVLGVLGAYGVSGVVGVRGVLGCFIKSNSCSITVPRLLRPCICIVWRIIYPFAVASVCAPCGPGGMIEFNKVQSHCKQSTHNANITPTCSTKVLGARRLFFVCSL